MVGGKELVAGKFKGRVWFLGMTVLFMLNLYTNRGAACV